MVVLVPFVIVRYWPGNGGVLKECRDGLDNDGDGDGAID